MKNFHNRTEISLQQVVHSLFKFHLSQWLKKYCLFCSQIFVNVMHVLTCSFLYFFTVSVVKLYLFHPISFLVLVCFFSRHYLSRNV